MFLYYQTQNDLVCYPQDSPNTSIWDNLNCRVIVVVFSLIIFLKMFIILNNKY